MKTKSVATSTLAVIGGWLVATISLCLDREYGGDLFARSGSFLVLVAVIVEYRLLASRNRFHNSQLRRHGEGKEVDFLNQHPSKGHRRLEVLSHITLIVGTLIWGYGDLVIR